jgi:hypothetical protein
MSKAKALFNGLCNLCSRGVTFHKREFRTDDARQYAYDYDFVMPTGVAGLTGITPQHNYFYATPPADFDYHVPIPQLPDDAPANRPNPLITPDLAKSFIANNFGRKV